VTDTAICIDVSKWQDPALFEWKAMSAIADQQKAAGLPPFGVIARASYGASGPNAVDPRFEAFASTTRDAGLRFGAYHFFRQTSGWVDQLALFRARLAAVGGLRPGDFFPVLDLEPNPANGDGPVNATLWNREARAMAEAMVEEWGGCILYMSSYFPEYLGAPDGATWDWINDPAFGTWLADYWGPNGATPPGKPRTPYHLRVELHQYDPAPVPWYANGSAPLDVNRYTTQALGSSLLWLPEDEVPVTPPDRPPVPTYPYDPDDLDAGFEKLADGLALAFQGADHLRKLR